MFKEYVTKIFSSSAEVDVGDDKNRFNIIYQKMLNTRWYITILTIMTLMLILFGIALCVAVGAHIAQEWKEILLLLLGAFIGSYNRVIDYWFNNSQRDDKLIEKIDQENDSDDLVKAKIAMMSKKGNGEPEVVNDPPLEMPNLDKMGVGKPKAEGPAEPTAPAAAPQTPPPSPPAAPAAEEPTPAPAAEVVDESPAPEAPVAAEGEAPKGEGEAASQGEAPQG